MTLPTTARAGQSPAQVEIPQILMALARHWPRFLLLWIIVSILLAAGALHIRPRFQAKGVVHINNGNDKLSKSSQGGLGSMLEVFGSGSDLESQKGILKTSALAIKTIRDLGLNAKLEGEERILPARPYLWEYLLDRDPNGFHRGLRVVASDTAPDAFGKVKLVLRFTDPKSFEIFSGQGEDAAKPLGRGQIGSPVALDRASFTLVLQPHPVEIRPGDSVSLTLVPAQSALKEFAQRLEIEGGGSPTRPNNLISVTYATRSPFVAQEVVQSLLDQFVELNRQWAASVSRAVVDFVGDELTKLRKDMDTASGRLAKYQEKVGLIAVDKSLEAEIKTIVQYQIDLDKSRLRLLQLEQLSKTLSSGNPDTFLLAFVADPLIERLGSRLGEINGQIAALGSQFKSDYPPLIELRSARTALLKDMQAALEQSLGRYRKEVDELGRVVAGYNERFSQMPEKARAMSDHHRATQVFEGLYIFLLQEQQKAQIAEGSTISNIRIVDAPFVPIGESWPSVPLLGLLAMAAGLLVSAASVVVPVLRIRWFTSIDEVKAAVQLPVFGIVPHRGVAPGRATPAVIETLLQTQFAESLRLLRANLQHALVRGRQHIVLVTSAMPQDGKTSIVANLAAALARSERVDRVLLIDADMHRPSLHGIFAVPQSPGLSDYLSGLVTLEQIVHTIELGAGRRIDVIPAGPVPPTPVELVDSKVMVDLLTSVREQYSFTLIDTPPYPLVATASVLAPHVDRVLSVCRLGYTDRAVYRAHVEGLMGFCKHVGMVINLSRRGGTYAGYGDSYGATYGSGTATAPKPKAVPREPGAPLPNIAAAAAATTEAGARSRAALDRPAAASRA